ncbi:hypothetical protein EDC04DRAFT_2869629 [Pisolithus marmoratus]|nr:hypothetical protein EDC04DRAFT_2869629 [Pisolithus marmoratus]
MLVRACQCVNAESYHMQLFHSKLCPSTFTRPSTVFTFAVLDDFLRDNIECGTSGRNYYNKLHQITSSVFPHLVADRYQELLQVAQQWWVLKLLKWSGFQDKTHCSTKGDLVLFCVACPQLGINVSPAADLDHWKYTRTLVMDGNFKAEHMHKRCPDNQVWLMDGHKYLKATPHIMEKSTCNNHKAISQASLNMDYSLANALGYNMTRIKHVIPPTLTIVPGISAWHVHGHRKECYARYSPLFIKGSGWVDELLDFQMNDSNFMKMIQMSRYLNGGH